MTDVSLRTSAKNQKDDIDVPDLERHSLGPRVGSNQPRSMKMIGRDDRGPW
jgi:hypothetical protein